jgi:hypothetical protein
MRNSGNDGVAVLVSVIILLFLCYVAVVAAVVLVALVALLFLGWVLTYWLLSAINSLTDNWITETEGLAALMIPALLCAVLSWWLVPWEWVWYLASILGWRVSHPRLALAIGGALLGLSWGFLSLLMLESKGGESETIGVNGMLALPAGSATQNGWGFQGDGDLDDLSLDLLQEGVLIGEDL